MIQEGSDDYCCCAAAAAKTIISKADRHYFAASAISAGEPTSKVIANTADLNNATGTHSNTQAEGVKDMSQVSSRY